MPVSMEGGRENISTPCYCALLRKASRRVSQFYDTALQATGLKITQFSILGALYHREGRQAGMGEFAESLVMDRSTLGHNLRPLERDGLIRLVPDQADRRARQVLLTPEGKARCEAAASAWDAAQARFAGMLGGPAMASLRDALSDVAALDFSTIQQPISQSTS